MTRGKLVSEGYQLIEWTLRAAKTSSVAAEGMLLFLAIGAVHGRIVI
jgi:hypothetical protein